MLFAPVAKRVRYLRDYAPQPFPGSAHVHLLRTVDQLEERNRECARDLPVKAEHGIAYISNAICYRTRAAVIAVRPDDHQSAGPARQSGEIDVTGSISKVGDRMVRTALCEAASMMLTRTVRISPLKSWAMAVARRRGTKKARVALARKLGVVLHRMWVDGTGVRWSNETAIMA